MNSKLLGDYGEIIASRYLRKHGYFIVSANYSCRVGEIDLIADWFYDDLYVYFEEIAEENGEVISTDSYADYVNDLNAGMAYYRANC